MFSHPSQRHPSLPLLWCSALTHNLKNNLQNYVIEICFWEQRIFCAQRWHLACGWSYRSAYVVSKMRVKSCLCQMLTGHFIWLGGADTESYSQQFQISKLLTKFARSMTRVQTAVKWWKDGWRHYIKANMPNMHLAPYKAWLGIFNGKTWK